MRVRPTILAAVMALLAAPALAQSPADPPATAATAAPGRLTLAPGQVTVVGGSTFRVGRDLYQVSGMRAPRPRLGACFYERLRGREARKQLVRIMGAGPIVVTPSATVTRRGARVAEVTARGRSVAQLMISRQVAVPTTATARNPWCIGEPRQRA